MAKEPALLGAGHLGQKLEISPNFNALAMHLVLTCTAAKSMVQRSHTPIYFPSSYCRKIAWERIWTMFASIAHLFHAWKRYGDVRRELSHLSDRELADIGITRSDIDRIASDYAHR